MISMWELLTIVRITMTKPESTMMARDSDRLKLFLHKKRIKVMKSFLKPRLDPEIC